MSSPNVRRRRSLAGQRGSLIVEMVVVTPLFALLLGVSFWFYKVHAAQMRVYQEAREPVWATATFGCGNAGETSASMPGPSPGVGVSGGAPPIIPADFTKVYQMAPGGPNNEVITRSVGTATGTAETSIEAAPAIGVRSTTFAASASMTCNERVEDGHADTYKRIVAGVFQP